MNNHYQQLQQQNLLTPIIATHIFGTAQRVSHGAGSPEEVSAAIDAYAETVLILNKQGELNPENEQRIYKAVQDSRGPRIINAITYLQATFLKHQETVNNRVPSAPTPQQSQVQSL